MSGGNKGAITREMEGGRKEGREIRGVGWGGGRGGRGGEGGGEGPRRGLNGQLLPQGPDMRDTFIVTGRVTPESSEDETGRITEGQTVEEKKAKEE